MQNYSKVRNWVEDLPKMGKSSFSIADAKEQFPDMPFYNIKNGLYRLTKTGKINSVWHGFYTISLPEYGLSGIAPPSEYIGQLMKYIGAHYYVGLLSAAAIQGAAHQSPQVYQVVCEKHLREKKSHGVKLEMIAKKLIQNSYLIEKNVNSGVIMVSSPELTAIDLLLYPNRAGGISHIATILSELAENLDYTKIEKSFFYGIPTSTIQRLGFILDEVLEEKNVSDILFDKAKTFGLTFRKNPLVHSSNMKKHVASSNKNLFQYSKKWKIEINSDVEPDI